MEKLVFDFSNRIHGKRIQLHQYTHIRAYHACRPTSIQNYLTNGIIPYTKHKAMTDAIRKLKTEKSEKEIIDKFEKQWDKSDVKKSRVWLAVNKEILLTGSGHYLIYGSEFLNALAMELGCREHLKNIGIPTIFHCDIPLEDIPKFWMDDVERTINDNMIEDISIYVPKVQAGNIICYEHPKSIENPYMQGSYYRPDYRKLKANISIY